MADASNTTAAVTDAPAPAEAAKAPAVETSAKTGETGTLLGKPTEGKTEEGSLLAKAKGEDPPAEEPKEAPKSEAPEEYEAFTAPEGIVLDESLIGEFKTVAKELGLSQERAQKLVDLQVKAETAKLAASEEAHSKMVADWRKQVTADPESKTKLASASRALDVFAKNPEVRHFLTETWLGDHPLVIEFLAEVGKSAGEDTFAGSTGAAPKARDFRNVFPSMQNS